MPGTLASALGQLGMMALDMRSHLGITVAKLLLQEFDGALDTRARSRMRQARVLPLGG